MEDWEALLCENPRIATDIQFRIIEEVFVDGTQETKTEILRAHKLVLAFVSDVFKALFYGAMREETEEILIRDTTIEGFKEFLKMIYILADKRCHTQVTDVKLLFEILNLTKRYIIPKLEAFVEEQLSSVNLTEFNVVPTVIVANEYRGMDGFQVVSGGLLKRCSRFLTESFSSSNLFQFLAQVETTFSEKTLSLIIQLLASANCKNCKKLPCLDGENVTEENAVHGARVKVLEDFGDPEMINTSLCPDGYARIKRRRDVVILGVLIDIGGGNEGSEVPLDQLDSVTFSCS